MSESEQMGRLRREIAAAYEGCSIQPNKRDWLIADAIDRLAADVAAVREAVCDRAADPHAAWREVIIDRDLWIKHCSDAIRERDDATRRLVEATRKLDEARRDLDGAIRGNTRLTNDVAALRARLLASVAEVERLKAELAARQAANHPGTLDSSPAAPQPAAPAPGWLTEEERAVVEDIASMIEQWFRFAWSDIDEKRCVVLRSILSRAGSPPVVEVPAMESLGDTACHQARAYRAALDKAGVPWKEVPRE